MARRLFTTASAISLMLCAATAAVWARSHWAADELQWGRTGGVAWAWTPKGYLELGLFLGDCSGQPAAFYGFSRGPAPVSRPIDTFVFIYAEPTDTRTTM